MNKPRDPVDAWLEADVELMHPPPGAFHRISRRARRRKAVQAFATVAGAVVIIAGLAAAPNLASFLPGASKTGSSVVGSGGAGRAGRTAQPAQGLLSRQPGSSPARPLPAASPAGYGRLDVTSGQPVPAGFRPLSVTFVGPNVGAVLGQVRSPCRGVARPCTSVAGTSTYGGFWYSIGAPAAQPSGPAGVSQLRFLNLRYGWAFGPALWYTTTGGSTWHQSSLTAGQPGATVTAVEALNGVAFALVGTCSGSGAQYASQCTSFTLYQSPASADAWRQVSGATNLTAPGGNGIASLVLASGSTNSPAAGYVLSPSGAVIGGNLASRAWHTLIKPPPVLCSQGPALSNGQAAHAVFASPGAGTLYQVCATGAAGMPASVSECSGGHAWRHIASLPSSRLYATSLAAQPGGVLVLASTAGIHISTDNGKHWQLAQGSPGGKGLQAGFSYVGMTTPSLGVAVPADPRLGVLFVTSNGGITWLPSRV